MSSSPKRLGLTQAELNTITAGKLVIGSTNSGSVLLSADIQPTGVNDLEIYTGQNVDLGTYSLTVNDDLLIQAANGIATGDSSGLDLLADHLQLQSTAGNLGSEALPLRLSVTTLAAEAAVNGSIHIWEQDSVTLAGSDVVRANNGRVYLHGGSFLLGNSNVVHDSTSVSLLNGATLEIMAFTI